MSQATHPSTSLLRLTVQSEGRRLDITIPRQVPLVEVMPGFARSLGVLDPTMTSSGYVLQRTDGTLLDPARSAADQDVEDGEVLTFARGSYVAVPRVYDDIVEAVLDVTGEQHEWTPRDNTRTALAVSLSFIALCGLLLLTGGRGSLLSIIVAASGTVLLLAASAFVGRLGQPEAGVGLGVAAGAFGALTAYLAVPPDQLLWGWPLAAAGGGAVVASGIAVAVTPRRSSILFVPMVTGASIAIPAVAAAISPPNTYGTYTLMVAVAAVLANALPWLALSTTQLRVISPQTDAEIFAMPAPISTPGVRRSTAAGHRILTSLRCALGLALVASTPLVAQTPWGALLCALAFVGFMFPARMSFARAHVLILLVLGAVGTAVTVTTAALTQPDLLSVMIIVLASVAAATIVITLLSPRARLRLARLADTAEIAVLATLLPIGLIASGLLN